MYKQQLSKKPRCILFIEDNPASTRLLHQVIGRIPNVHCLNAAEPISGLSLAVANKPDLILLDINLPNMNGVQVLESLRLDSLTKHITVIAISANAMQEDIDNAISMGFDNYITKPFNVEALLKIIIEYLPEY